MRTGGRGQKILIRLAGVGPKERRSSQRSKRLGISEAGGGRGSKGLVIREAVATGRTKTWRSHNAGRAQGLRRRARDMGSGGDSGAAIVMAALWGIGRGN